MNIAFVGSVDHGKSTLIGQLLKQTGELTENRQEISENNLAFVTDSLEEEQDNKITIDTTQIKWKNHTIIDNPGHLEFLKNMITGSSRADLAILMIDITEGITEQTDRHLNLIQFLDVKHIIAVINKMDKISYELERFEKLKTKILTKYVDVEFEAIIPISALKGTNVIETYEDWNEQTLIDSINKVIENIQVNKNTLLPIQGVFDNIALGRLSSGVLSENKNLKVYPENKEIQIKKIYVNNQPTPVGKKGDNVGIVTSEKIKRGDIITDVKLRTSDEIISRIFWVENSQKNGLLKMINQESSFEIEGEYDKNSFCSTLIKCKELIISKQFPETSRFMLTNNNSIIGFGMIIS